MQALPLYTSQLFSISSNVHMVDIEYRQGFFLNTLAVVDFSEFLLHPFIFTIKDSRSV